jgi:hypothetical protein
MAAGRRTGLGIDCFPCCSTENVAMTVETETDFSRESTTAWAPKARRQGEQAGWTKPPKFTEDRDDGVFFAPARPAPAWPRVFPGI